jgi:hypothetical protein
VRGAYEHIVVARIVARVSPEGVVLDTGVRVSTSGVSEYRPNTSDDGSRSFVVWSGSSMDCYSRFVNRDGVPEGSVVTLATGAASGPDAACGDSCYLAVWFTGTYPALDLYAFDIATGTWNPALSGMPFISRSGKSKKSKDGGAGVWVDNGIYAFKGGNTQEFWRYFAARDSWAEMETIPLTAPGGAKKKKVRGGADLAAFGSVLYATKGNKSLELWRSGLPLLSGSRPVGSGNVMSGPDGDGLRFTLRVAPNPLTSAATISCSLARAGNMSLKLYDITGALVSTLAQGHANAGSHTARIDASRLARGVYLLRLESGDYRTAKKLILEQDRMAWMVDLKLARVCSKE